MRHRKSVAGVASSGSAEFAAAAGADLADGQHGNTDRGRRGGCRAGPYLHIHGAKYLLSGGRGRSWETVTGAKINKVSRYIAIGKPLWSRAAGYYQHALGYAGAVRRLS